MKTIIGIFEQLEEFRVSRIYIRSSWYLCVVQK